MKPEPSVLSEEAFEAFVPQLDSNGDFLTYRDVADKPAEHVWTLVEGDGPWRHLYALPGFHIVNVLGYLTTEKPWTDVGLTAYWFFDDTPGWTAVLEDGDEVDDVGDSEAEAIERIEDTYEQKVVSIRPHDEENA